MTPDDASWNIVMPAAELPEGEVKAATFGALQIAIYNVGGEFYATDNVCTHAYAELTDGLLDGCEIECPLHAARFDVRNGEALTSPAEVALACYPVRVRAGIIEVSLTPKASE